jgi:hypothetical protein
VLHAQQGHIEFLDAEVVENVVASIESTERQRFGGAGKRDRRERLAFASRRGLQGWRAPHVGTLKMECSVS